jgi:hypothetical protein
VLAHGKLGWFSVTGAPDANREISEEK